MIKKFAIIPLLLAVISCSRNFYQYGRLEIHVPPGISIDENEILQRLAAVKLTEGSGFILRVTVYGYSGGAEIVTLKGDELATTTGRAWIKGMVQVLDGDSIADVFFIEVSGDGREEALDRFCVEAINGISGRSR